jgi:hypothetical protein
MVIVNKVNNKITELLNFVIHKCLSKATKLQWPRGKKIPPAVTLGMAIVNKGINKITELLNFVIHKCLSKATKLQ